MKRNLTGNMISGEAGINTTEDLLYSTEILLRANAVCLLPATYYVNYERSESLTHAVSDRLYVQNQLVILEEIKEMVVRYGADPRFTNNVLLYVEKFIDQAVCRVGFLEQAQIENSGQILESFRPFSEMTERRLNRLALSLSNRYYCLARVMLRFGPKTGMAILMERFYKQAHGQALIG